MRRRRQAGRRRRVRDLHQPRRLQRRGGRPGGEGLHLPGGLCPDGPPELREAHRRRGHQEHGEAPGVPGGQRRRPERLPQLGAGLIETFLEIKQHI